MSHKLTIKHIERTFHPRILNGESPLVTPKNTPDAQCNKSFFELRYCIYSKTGSDIPKSNRQES